ncbi:MAG: bifunctional adenosylcobinamide kinase/adenosylcobinamide-phosphate guanylyltransferase [Lachnospiraceae bacterium]|nr:bifunctional adenosylcobinamide kinase/adenosylcobinamide-phosphate guanylyltransferase [Lachnospiraceae bacterium]
MLGLVIGDAASGKSEYAESLAMKLSEKRIYLATMRNDGRESAERIEKHRQMRMNKGFATFECPLKLKDSVDKKLLEQPDFFEGACVLLEDIPNLTANEMFNQNFGGDPEERPGGNSDPDQKTNTDPVKKLDTDPARRLFEEIMYLSQKTAHMIIVTGNLFTGGCDHDTMTMDYLKSLAGLNNSLAAACDEVYEVVCGIPVTLKKRE